MMELHNPFSNIIITFIVSFFFLLLLFKIVKKCNTNINLPPGPRTLPFIGNLHQIITSSLLHHHHFKNLADKYGPLVHLKLGEVPYLIVSSSEMAKEIMKTHDLAFCDRPNILMSTLFSNNATGISLAKYGDYWRQLRKMCVIELLSAKRVKSFESIRYEEVSNLIKSISASEGLVVNLTQKIFTMTLEITTRATIGKKNKYQQQQLVSEIDEASRLFEAFSIADFYPSIKMLQRMNWEKKNFERLQREVDMILQNIIEDHKSNHGEASNGEDLLDVLLKIQQENDPSQYRLTDDDIKSVIWDMFSAGSDAASIIVLWGMSEMLKNAKVMEAAQVEVRRVYDKKGYVDETELHQLIYLKAVIKETMRLHPPLPLLLPKESRERCQINGYDIPAKTRVTVNAWAIGRDPKIWVDAESFKPERFVNSPIDFQGTHFEYIPFGAGRRICPGIALGLCNVELSFAQLLYHFDWKLPNGLKNEELDMTELSALAVGRKHDLYLIPTTRRHL